MRAHVARWAHRLWAWSSRGAARRFRAVLDDPTTAQHELLRRHLAAHADTVYGREHGFGRIRSYEDFRDRIPVVAWDDMAPWVERIRLGESNGLTADPVDRLVPSSGSTAAVKLIPYTATLRAQLREAVGVWVHDLARRHPPALAGRAYWSVSPAVALPAVAGDSAIPVGFDDDTAYLGSLAQRLAALTLAVPPQIRHVGDPGEFRYRTLRHLVAARDLSLISVWHPSFLALLLDALPTLQGRLTDDLRRDDPDRAREIAALNLDDPAAWVTLWPRLALVSAWGDGPATGPFRSLIKRLPTVPFQAKGLLATEGVVTIPLGDERPMAVNSHLLELVDDDGQAVLPGDPSIETGREYGVLLTTGGGLHRYRLGDRVRVTGFVGRVPSLSFVGRDDRVSDLVGEKLSEGFVAGVLETLLTGLDAVYYSLAPLAPNSPGSGPPGYALHLETAAPPPPDLAHRLDIALAANPHYRWARALGQLTAPRIVPVTDGHATSLENARRRGRRLGDIKPAALSVDISS